MAQKSKAQESAVPGPQVISLPATLQEMRMDTHHAFLRASGLAQDMSFTNVANNSLHPEVKWRWMQEIERIRDQLEALTDQLTQLVKRSMDKPEPVVSEDSAA